MIQGGSGVGGVATTDVPTKSSKKLGVDIDFLPRNQVDVQYKCISSMDRMISYSSNRPGAK